MANVIQQASTSLGSFGWTSLGNALLIVLIVFAVAILTGIVVFIMWFTSFNINVKIFTPLGYDPNMKKKAKGIKLDAKTEGVEKTFEKNNIVFNRLESKRTKGKFITVKGNPYFVTRFPYKKLEPVSMDYMYDDGIYLVKLTKEVLIPIPKPNLTANIGKDTVLNVQDYNKWRVWNNMQADRINNRYQELDAQKKMVMYFVTGIVVVTLLGGFIMWLIYSSANRGFDAAEKFNRYAQSLVGGGPQ